MPSHKFRLTFDTSEASANTDAAPRVSEVNGDAPWDWPPVDGYLIVRDPRRLTLTEWLRVRVLRRPDPRIEVYSVAASEPT